MTVQRGLKAIGTRVKPRSTDVAPRTSISLNHFRSFCRPSTGSKDSHAASYAQGTNQLTMHIPSGF